MINRFVVKALKQSNHLVILLDGYFMDSEIELAEHLVDNEVRNLNSGFSVLIDVEKMDSKSTKFALNLKKLIVQLNARGCGKIKVKKSRVSDRQYNLRSVGFYPHEFGYNLL